MFVVEAGGWRQNGLGEDITERNVAVDFATAPSSDEGTVGKTGDRGQKEQF